MTLEARRLAAVGLAVMALAACGGAPETTSSVSASTTPRIVEETPSVSPQGPAGRPAGEDDVDATGGHAEPSPAPGTSIPRSMTDDEPSFSGVIVDLDVQWRHESELSDAERREQRARIEAAQDEVVDDLGVHGELRRRLTETAQMSLGVDPEGREILERHELVKRVSDDTADAPADSG